MLQTKSKQGLQEVEQIVGASETAALGGQQQAEQVVDDVQEEQEEEKEEEEEDEDEENGENQEEQEGEENKDEEDEEEEEEDGSDTNGELQEKKEPQGQQEGTELVEKEAGGEVDGDARRRRPRRRSSAMGSKRRRSAPARRRRTPTTTTQSSADRIAAMKAKADADKAAREKALKEQRSKMDALKAENTFCGMNLPMVRNSLAPPVEVQRIMTFMMSPTYSFGVENPPRNPSPCANLPLDSDIKYILVTVSAGILQGSKAALQKRKLAGGANGKETSADTYSKFSSAPAISENDVFCIAVRPCGKGTAAEQKKSFLKTWDFGFYSADGIPIYQVGPVSLKFKGLAFSTAGNLKVGKLKAPIWGYDLTMDGAEAPTGLHWWFSLSAAFPVGKTKAVEVEVEGTLGAYVELDGEKDIGSFLVNLVSDGDGIMGVARYLPSKDFYIKMLGTVKADIVFDLNALFGKKAAKDGKEPQKLKITAHASLLREAKFVVGKMDSSYLAQYFSAKVTMNLAQLLKLSGFLADIFNADAIDAQVAVELAFFLKSKMSLKISQGFRVAASVKMTCDFFDFFPAVVFEVFPLMGDLKKACSNNKLETSLQIVALDNMLSFEDTCFTILNKQYCLDVLPTCPPPVGIGKKCSENADCQGDEFGTYKRGYCKSRNKLKTTAFCTGTCERLAQTGESCSAATTNTWNLATSAENEKCESHFAGARPACLCATCADNNAKLADGKKCATDANCDSGYCHKGGVLATIVNQGCKGTCKALLDLNSRCSYDAECKSKACSAGCRDLFNCVGVGKCSECLDHEHCGSGQYCHSYKCYNKKNDHESATETYMCKSGNIVCNYCAPKRGSAGLPAGKTCATDDNCKSGYCHKGGLLKSIASVGCKGKCKDLLAIGKGCSFDAECTSTHCSTGCRDLFNCVTSGKCVTCLDHNHCGSGQYCSGHKCYNKKNNYEKTDASWKCKSNNVVCDRCAPKGGSAGLPTGSDCATDDNCKSGYCNKGGLLSTIANQGCKGKCKALLSINSRCSFDAECQSGRCSVGCRDLFNCVTNGKCVACLDHGDCSSNQYCDGYKCHNKRKEYWWTDKHWKCASGKDVCGKCTPSGGKMKGGEKCSVDGDCSGSCGKWYQNCWGCRCHCSR